MKKTIWIVMGMYIVVMAVVITVCSIEQAEGDEPVALPPEILACITDIECERAADALCEQGELEWCIEEA